mgnify:CR=1 FL=1
MRDIVYRALTSVSRKKQDICIQETLKQNGITSMTERRCRYFVMGKTIINNIDNIEKIAQAKFSDAKYKKRHYYVLKTRDSARCSDTLLCKIAGMLYAVHGVTIYCIAYVHSFKITFKSGGII